MKYRFLIFGAHPDDCDLAFGGTALQLLKAGHEVKFVSVTNGDAGHHIMQPAELAARRKAETQRSAQVAGLTEYEVLDNHDGWLTASQEDRAQIIRIIRRFNPHVVLTHRLFDYHADHRATAQLVQDASFLAGVPLCCPDTPVPDDFSVVYGFLCDLFMEPWPFKPDVGIIIDPVIEQKIDMVMCQESQFFEWLPWIEKNRQFDAAKLNEQEKRDHIRSGWLFRDEKNANRFRDILIEQYGEAGRNARYAEFFALMPLREEKDVAGFRKFFQL